MWTYSNMESQTKRTTYICMYVGVSASWMKIQQTSAINADGNMLYNIYFICSLHTIYSHHWPMYSAIWSLKRKLVTLTGHIARLVYRLFSMFNYVHIYVKLLPPIDWNLPIETSHVFPTCDTSWHVVWVYSLSCSQHRSRNSSTVSSCHCVSSWYDTTTRF